MNIASIIPLDLQHLRVCFQNRGHDIRIVGGAVRDMLSGITPKDIDLATDATPNEQAAVYGEGGFRFYETGLSHGTLTVIVGDTSYEVTTLRTEQDHDGRHATTRWTRDWTEDLSRRDLTINAMALTLDGSLIDPFGGAEDLSNGNIRFVGNAKERMCEDYLRVLRWLRFHGRIAPKAPLDEEAVNAVRSDEVRRGILTLSAERVWQEMSRLIVTDAGVRMMDVITSLGLARCIPGMPLIDGTTEERKAFVRAHRTCRDPVALYAVYVGDEVGVRQLARDWRWSSEERERGAFIAKWHKISFGWKRLLAVDGISKEWVSILLQTRGTSPETMMNWPVPTFPVTGHDLMQRGMKPGPQLGATLAKLRQEWGNRDFRPSKEDLLKLA